jgi:hypothetical protein
VPHQAHVLCDQRTDPLIALRRAFLAAHRYRCAFPAPADTSVSMRLPGSRQRRPEPLMIDVRCAAQNWLRKVQTLAAFQLLDS